MGSADSVRAAGFAEEGAVSEVVDEKVAVGLAVGLVVKAHQGHLIVMQSMLGSSYC